MQELREVMKRVDETFEPFKRKRPRRQGAFRCCLTCNVLDFPPIVLYFYYFLKKKSFSFDLNRLYFRSASCSRAHVERSIDIDCRRRRCKRVGGTDRGRGAAR